MHAGDGYAAEKPQHQRRKKAVGAEGEGEARDCAEQGATNIQPSPVYAISRGSQNRNRGGIAGNRYRRSNRLPLR